MKRCMNQSDLQLEGEKTETHESKKKKKLSPIEDRDESHLNHCNAISKSPATPIKTHLCTRGPDSTKQGANNIALPNHSGFPNSVQTRWNPWWGQHGSGFRSNLNYCNLEHNNRAISSHEEHSLTNPSSCRNKPRTFGVEPESFIKLKEKFDTKYPPDDITKEIENKFLKISKDVWTNFKVYQQHASIFEQKIKLWSELERVLRRRFRCVTHVFGSTLNGFGSNDSDMDLCMFNEKSDSKKGRDEVRYLADVRRIIRKDCHGYISGNIELVPAKIPILKFFDQFGKIEVDLSCNNKTSIRNTNLLYCYSQIDWRVRPLVLTIKEWAKSADINEARFSTLSSYCLTLMVIHFLQVGLAEPVVPNLHDLHPQIFHPESDIFDLPFTCDIEPNYQTKNKMSLGELFFAFFEYYTKKFDFAVDVGSIRAGKTLTSSQCLEYAKKNKVGPGQWSAYILMEEPFDRSNAGRAICRRDKFDLILKAFDKGHEAVKNGTKLDSLLNAADEESN